MDDSMLRSRIERHYRSWSKAKFQELIWSGQIKKTLLTPEQSGYKEGVQRSVVSCTASSFGGSAFLNPACVNNLSNISEVDDVAKALGLDITTEDSSLRARIQAALSDDEVRQLCLELSSLIDEEKSAVELAFATLVKRIIKVLKSTCVFKGNKLHFCVGGVLSDETCALRGMTDYSAENESGDIAFVTECEPSYSFPTHDHYCSESKGYQLFGAFFGSKYRPTFLYTSEHFLLLVKDIASEKCMKFPEKMSIHPICSREFVEAISFCLLSSSTAMYSTPMVSPLKSTINIENSPVTATETMDSDPHSAATK